MVHFVGAGPGASDLITVRGDRLLREADVVIYAGSLVNPELLKGCRTDCAVYDSAYMTLEEVLEVIRDAERRGEMTVRLHTGDPSIYGAIREQMDALDRMGIAYDVCPGVSSFCGAAAALNLEYTLPEVSQSVIITRMEGRTKVSEKESIRSFAAHQYHETNDPDQNLCFFTLCNLISIGYKQRSNNAGNHSSYNEHMQCDCIFIIPGYCGCRP